MVEYVTEILMKVAPILAPGVRELPDREQEAMRRTIASTIEGLSVKVQRKLRLFVMLLRWLPMLRYGRSLGRLPETRKMAFFGSLQRSPLTPIRAGFLGVRTLIFMGYFGREGAGPEFSYDPSLEGNRELIDA